jgi:enamine deaminase RidA (YjgF/YER057c/UK114 family)
MARPAVEYINPAGMHSNPAFTQVVSVREPARTIYIGMQLPQDEHGQIVGKGDIAAQTEQVLANLSRCLEAAGAAPEHVIMWTIYIVQGQDLMKGAAAGMRWWGNRPNPPANNVFFVAALAVDALVGIEAVAVVPIEED